MKAYVSEADGTTWITLTDIGDHAPTITLTEAEAKALRNKLQSVLGGIGKHRAAEARKPPLTRKGAS